MHTAEAHLWTPPLHTIRLATGQPRSNDICNPDAPSIEEYATQCLILCKRITRATELAFQAVNKKELPWQKRVPHIYHSYGKVFSEKQAMRFPASRPWDHAIELLSDAPHTLDCKVYTLAPAEQDTLIIFLKEHLDKGYIRRSNSPYASPFFI